MYEIVVTILTMILGAPVIRGLLIEMEQVESGLNLFHNLFQIRKPLGHKGFRVRWNKWNKWNRLGRGMHAQPVPL